MRALTSRSAVQENDQMDVKEQVCRFGGEATETLLQRLGRVLPLRSSYTGGADRKPLFDNDIATIDC